MTPPLSAVTYEGLPLSSGAAHSLGRMTPRAAYAATMSFLQVCTEPLGRVEYSFTVHDVPELQPPRHLERELERRFGRGRRIIFDEEELPDALDLLDHIHPQPTNRWGMAPIWLEAATKFRLVDPRTGRSLANQEDRLFRLVGFDNRLRLFLDNRARLQLEFCLPHADDELLRLVLPWLQEHLPCKLSRKQWRTWTSTKSGSLRARKLDLSGLI